MTSLDQDGAPVSSAHSVHREAAGLDGSSRDDSQVRERRDIARRIWYLRGVILLLTALQVVGTAFASVKLDEVFDLDPDVEGLVRVWLPVLGGALGLTFLVFDWKRDMNAKLESLNVVANMRPAEEAFLTNIEQRVTSLVRSEIEELTTLLPVMNLYVSAAEHDPYDQRKKIIDSAFRRLEDLNDGLMIVHGDEYYDWLKDRLCTSPLQTVEAISVRPLVVYEEDAREEQFIGHNHAAVARGVQVVRIFVVRREELLEEKNRSILAKHFNSPVNCALIWQEKLRAEVLSALGGGGLSIYDRREVFFDRSYFEQDFQEDVDTAGISMRSRDTKQSVPRARLYQKNHRDFANFLVLFDRVNGYVSQEMRVRRKFRDAADRRKEAENALQAIRGSLLEWADETGKDGPEVALLRSEMNGSRSNDPQGGSNEGDRP